MYHPQKIYFCMINKLIILSTILNPNKILDESFCFTNCKLNVLKFGLINFNNSFSLICLSHNGFFPFWKL